MINVHILPILNDNYCYILEADNGDIGIVDPGESKPVLDYLNTHNLVPSHIFLTHHHADHIAGTTDIKQEYNCPIFGPEKEANKIGLLDEVLNEASELFFGNEAIEIIETPGHTLGQINFFFKESELLFSGDTLFVMGCGRVFEGTMEQMHTSLQALAILPENTKVYCGHEYTLSNAEFLASVAPENQKISQRLNEIREKRQANLATVPSTIREEKETNLFLQAKTENEFTALRRQKDAS